MSFDRLAPYYRTMERILAGRRLQDCRTAFLQEIQQSRSLLLLGEGHGRFLSELARHGSKQEVLVVDASAGMMEQARASVQENGSTPANIRFLEADILRLQLPSRFDAVVTHFFLDCFTSPQLAKLVPKIASWIAPAGRWFIADFQVPAQPILAWRARLVLAVAYRFFRWFADLPASRLVPPQPLVASAGLKRLARREFNCGLLYSEFWRRS